MIFIVVLVLISFLLLLLSRSNFKLIWFDESSLVLRIDFSRLLVDDWHWHDSILLGLIIILYCSRYYKYQK